MCSSLKSLFRSLMLCSLLAGSWACTEKEVQELINKEATAETKALYRNLKKISQQKILFGHQDDLAYGVGWKYEAGRSDVKEVVNDYPALYGWDIAGIELDSAKNIDGVPFEKMRAYIAEGYQRGGAITISWHFRNPLTGGSSWDTTSRAVAAILPGGTKHELYKTWLDKAATFLHSLKGERGEAIPILFRPFHEITGDWFWWGSKSNQPEELIEVWRFTVHYLIQEKQLHQLIWVYNTNDFESEEAFLRHYPGDEYADVLSFDHYFFNGGDRGQFIEKVKKEIGIIRQLGKAKNKLTAFAETGYEAVPDSLWWTNTLYPAIADSGIAYVLVWRNEGFMSSENKMHFYGPHAGHPSAPDFKSFYQKPQLLFGEQLKTYHIYQ